MRIAAAAGIIALSATFACATTGQPKESQVQASQTVGGSAIKDVNLPVDGAKAPGTRTRNFIGSSFPIAQRTVGGARVTSTIHNLRLTDGAIATAMIVYRTHAAEDAQIDPDRCPATCGDPDKPCHYIVDLVSMTWVQAYGNGRSAFSGAVPNDPDRAQSYATFFQNSFICSNGLDFHIDARGKIIDARGPGLQDKKGTWRVTADTSTYLTDGAIEVTFQ